MDLAATQWLWSVTQLTLSWADQSQVIVPHGLYIRGLAAVSLQMSLVLNFLIISLYLIICIYCTTRKRKFFPKIQTQQVHFSLIALCPFLLMYSHLTSLCTPTMPHALVSLHTLTLLCTSASLHSIISPHHLALSSTVYIRYRLLATMPGDYPLPLNHTLRAS